MKWIRTMLPWATLAAVLASGCSKKTEPAQVAPDEGQLAAKVGDWTITRDFVDDYLRRLPEPQRQKFDTPEGRALLADKLMQEELSYLEAKKLNLAAKDGSGLLRLAGAQIYGEAGATGFTIDNAYVYWLRPPQNPPHRAPE